MNRTNLINFILCCGITAFMGMMVACQSDELDMEALQDHQGSEDEVSINMVLHCSGGMKNASGTEITSGKDEHGYGNENVINKARVYFYNSRTKSFAFQKDLKDLAYEPANATDTYDRSYISSSFKVKKGTYDIFVIANMDSIYLPSRVSKEIDFLNSIDSTSYKSGMATMLTTKGLIMTNRGNSNLNVCLTMDKQEQTISVDMERVVAKISFGQAKDKFELFHEGKKYATVNITNFKLVNLPKMYYLFRHVGEVSDFNNPPAYTLENNFGEQREEMYVFDPLFFLKDETVSQDSIVYDKYYENWYGNMNEEGHAPMPVSPGKAIYYILENCMYNGYQKKAYVTGVLMKGAVTMDSVYCYNADKDTVEYDGNQEHWSDRLFLYEFKFFDSARALNRKYDREILDESKENNYTDKELRDLGVKQIVRNFGIYETKYSYWIKHKDDGDKTHSSIMEHAIIRNNYYKLTLTGITGLGPSSVSINEIYADVEPNSYIDFAP